MFVTFEGIEGSGKSTQLELCGSKLKQLGLDIIITKEPGGTNLGKVIRQWLLNPDTKFYHSYTEVLLFIADRLEHVETVIKPALAKGKIVLCDRFKDSTTAYQVAGRQLDNRLISDLNMLTDVEPDLTLLFDCSVEIGLQRAKDRAKLDRFEDEELEFHHRIYNQYHEIFKNQPSRVKLVNANNTIEAVTKEAMSILLNQIKIKTR